MGKCRYLGGGLDNVEYGNIVQVNITDDTGKRFEVPRIALSINPFNQSEITRNINDFVTIDSTDKFSLSIHEFQNPNSVYFKINDYSLLISEYYLSMNTQINTNGNLFGLGERVTSFLLKKEFILLGLKIIQIHMMMENSQERMYMDLIQYILLDLNQVKIIFGEC